MRKSFLPILDILVLLYSKIKTMLQIWIHKHYVIEQLSLSTLQGQMYDNVLRMTHCLDEMDTIT